MKQLILFPLPQDHIVMTLYLSVINLVKTDSGRLGDLISFKKYEYYQNQSDLHCALFASIASLCKFQRVLIVAERNILKALKALKARMTSAVTNHFSI